MHFYRFVGLKKELNLFKVAHPVSWKILAVWQVIIVDVELRKQKINLLGSIG